MVAVIAVIILDLGLVLYRQFRGIYGNNDLEFGEAVRYVMDQKRSGRGPGHFDRVFPVLRADSDHFAL